MSLRPKSPFEVPADSSKKLKEDLAKAGCCGRNTVLRKHKLQADLRRKLIPER